MTRDELKELNQEFIQDEIRVKNQQATRRATSTNRIESSRKGIVAFQTLKAMGFSLKSPMLSYLGFNLAKKEVRK